MLATTDLLSTVALVESATHAVKAGYVLDMPTAGVLAVMASLTERFAPGQRSERHDAESPDAGAVGKRRSGPTAKA